MLSLFSLLFGFLTPVITDIVGLFKSAQEHKNKMAELQLQAELVKAGYTQKLDELELQADSAKSVAAYNYDNSSEGLSQWVLNLRSSVRPVITYSFFFLFVLIELTTVYWAMNHGVNLVESLKLIWTDDISLLFSGIIGFWFGTRNTQFRSNITSIASAKGVKAIKID